VVERRLRFLGTESHKSLNDLLSANRDQCKLCECGSIVVVGSVNIGRVIRDECIYISVVEDLIACPEGAYGENIDGERGDDAVVGGSQSERPEEV